MNAIVRAEILLLLPVLEPAGAERIVAQLALRLPAHGFGVSVVCLEDDDAPVGRELKAAGVRVTGLKLLRRRSLACAKALQKILPAARPLVLHTHLFHANIAGRLLLARLKPSDRAQVPLLNTVHVAERRFRPWQFALDRITAKYARAEICVSRAVANFQRAQTGLPPEFFRVIENGVDLTRFTPSTNKLSGPPLVVSVGRLDPQKDYATLLHAWRRIEEAHPHAQLAIAGAGAEEAALRKLIESLSLRRVRLLGFVADIPALLQRASLYVQPSAWEGFGLSVAEAMATGVPVVVSDADSLPELVRHDHSGLIVPKGNADALAQAVLALLNDGPRAARLAAAARQEAVARFSVERMVAEYVALYSEMVKQR